MKKNKFLKLKLIKTKTYKKTYAFTNLKIEDIEHRLKKALQIISKYHINNQKILFLISFSILKIKRLLQNTKHIILNKNLLVFQTLKSKIKYNLVVVLGKSPNFSIIHENYKKKIPIIFVGNYLHVFNNKLNYKVPGNFVFYKKKIREYLFFVLLKSIFKKFKKYDFKK